MDQQNEPNAPHQVIYITQAPKDKQNLKDAYNVKAATTLGVIHIVCGTITLSATIAGLVDGNFSVGTGIWTSVLFFVSGGLAIGGARSGNKFLVVATMVMAIISAVSARILLIRSAIRLGIGYKYRHGYISDMALVFGLLIAMSATLPSSLPLSHALSHATRSAVAPPSRAPSTTIPTNGEAQPSQKLVKASN